MRVLLTGASGQLGGYLLRELLREGSSIHAWSGSRTGQFLGVPWQLVDLADRDQVVAAFRQARPEFILHAGAMASVADCRRDPQRTYQVNTQGSALLAELAAQAGARLLLVSTDLVFDGEKAPYREQDPPAPLSVYGRSKAEAEKAVLVAPRSSVVRVSLLFGPSLIRRPTFFDQQLTALRERRAITLFTDEWRTPLSLLTAARGLLSILRSDHVGLLHMGGPERMSRFEMGRRLAGHLGADPAVMLPAERDSVSGAEPRPCDVSLDTAHWRERFPHVPWPNLEEALSALPPP
jgi:dTDP-4-dehydrorhamnose reductase